MKTGLEQSPGIRISQKSMQNPNQNSFVSKSFQNAGTGVPIHVSQKSLEKAGQMLSENSLSSTKPKKQNASESNHAAKLRLMKTDLEQSPCENNRNNTNHVSSSSISFERETTSVQSACNNLIKYTLKNRNL